uniref:Uncharacterized protein n=1 Tax=viral metagenome TaxID=1070528 RepID=A0A6H2A4P0_9ZZZZ
MNNETKLKECEQDKELKKTNIDTDDQTTIQKQIGEISVDAGIVWIGDPCYILHKNLDEIPQEIGRTWEEFCENIKEMKHGQQFNHNKNITGLGVVVGDFGGDGVYPVMAEIENDQVKSITINFY